ncbi:MAG: DUF615 domain-containing protein, partial [Pseudomonadales bacterium]|nr:DUF615 domain-containing protein [Pseudomonadales bacterium]
MSDLPEKKSKSQVKREMDDLRRLGTRLLELPDDQLESLDDEALVNAIRECKRISRGGARKRQIQYIGKLMRATDVDQVQQLLDRFDASSRAHTVQFHKLERWRQELMDGEPGVMPEIIEACPDVDRQHLNQPVRNAGKVRDRQRQPPVGVRKLF